MAVQTKKEWYEERITKKRLYLEKAEDGSLAQMLDEGVESATFDTGTYGARQHYKTLKMDSLTAYITVLESQIERYMRKLRGGGLVNLNANRRRPF